MIGCRVKQRNPGNVDDCQRPKARKGAEVEEESRHDNEERSPEHDCQCLPKYMIGQSEHRITLVCFKETDRRLFAGTRQAANLCSRESSTLSS